jgi:hypothetical protein
MAMKSDAKPGNPRAECGALAFWELSLGIGSAAAFTMSYVGNPSGAMGSLSPDAIGRTLPYAVIAAGCGKNSNRAASLYRRANRSQIWTAPGCKIMP